MTIELINKEQYNRLLLLQQQHPVLTYQNTGYDNFDKSKMNDSDKEAFSEVTEILKKAIKGFREFQNFRYSKKTNKLQIRFQYNYSPSFTGVGYLELQELLNGFKE